MVQEFLIVYNTNAIMQEKKNDIKNELNIMGLIENEINRYIKENKYKFSN